jgi:hypothetical protein
LPETVADSAGRVRSRRGEEDDVMRLRAVAELERNATIAVYPDHDRALNAIRRLQSGGYDSDHISVVGKGVKETDCVQGFVGRGAQTGECGTWGAFWGDLSGWFPLGFIWLPHVGWVAVGGWLAATLVGSAASPGMAALTALAVPEEEIASYEADLLADRYLVVVHGTAVHASHARALLEASAAFELNSYNS